MGRRKLESKFQLELKNKLYDTFPGCVIIKTDIQGYPDLLIIWQKRWAMLEVKRSEKERNDPEPNQEYFVEMFDEMSFCSFIYPEIEEEVLDDLQRALKSNRSSRVSIR